MNKLSIKSVVLLFPIFALLLSGCSPLFSGDRSSNTPLEVESELAREESPELPAGDLEVLVQGNSEFALDLFHQIRNSDGNLFYSPYSISSALAMTYAGARENTAREMAAGLHFNLPQERLHPGFNKLERELTSRGDIELPEESGDPFQINIANAIWGQQNFQFETDFLDTLARSYGAGLRLLDFVNKPDESRQEINRWVEDETQEKIQDLLPEGSIDSDTRLVLSNAIYFNAGWQEPFQADRTKDGLFNTLDGEKIEVPMMEHDESKTFPYFQEDGFQAFEMPYVGGEMSMLVLLPDPGEFKSFEKNFSLELLEKIEDGLASQSLQLTFPKFEYESELSLARTLAGMGMPEAFSSTADFSGMTGGKDLFISDVFHKAFVSVDEEGTEAAAATAVVMKLTSMPVDPLEISVDRPFLFLIRDRVTGSVLFIGKVVNPAQ